MASKSYIEKLKDPRWQRKRLEVLNRDNFTCQGCGCTTKTLHVHHKKYEGYPWDIDNCYLVTLCDDCHETEGWAMQEYIELFISTFNSKPFLSDDLREISFGLSLMEMQDNPPIIAKAYAFAFANPDVQKMILELYNRRILELKESSLWQGSEQ